MIPADHVFTLCAITYDAPVWITDHDDVDIIAALYGDDGLFRHLPFRLEVNQAINAGVCAFLLAAKGNGT